MKKRINLTKEPLKDSWNGDIRAATLRCEKSLRGFYYERGNDMENKVRNEVAGALYQIHSFAKLIGDNYTHITSPNYDGAGSDHVLAFVNLVQEKTEFCLKAIDNDSVEVTT